MLVVRNLASFRASVFIIALVAVAALAQGASANGSKPPVQRARVLSPINLAVLIQDDLVSQVSNELKATRDFIRSLPAGSQVMVGYITSGSLQVRQPFTTDLRRAAGSLRILVSSPSASPFNPYVEVLEALRRFDPEGKNRNVLLLISDGLDDSRGSDPATVLHSIDLERAISEAKRREVVIYSFYAPSAGLSQRDRLAASYGQSSLQRVSDETGGEAFFQGLTGFVSFRPYFKRLTRALNQLE
jgi:hypothetical protein